MSEISSGQEQLDGTPARVQEPYVDIKFQCGPVKEVSTNGTTMEAVLRVVLRRIEGFQRGPFKCVENELARGHVQAAINWLECRTTLRIKQGVEGKNEIHESEEDVTCRTSQ